MKKILLDTNFLIDLIRFKVDFKEIDRLIEDKYVLSTTGSVMSELKHIAESKTKAGKNARVALQLIEQNNIKILKDSADADKAMLTLANENTIIATNDAMLRKKLKRLDSKTIYLRAKKYLAIG